jgi:hypothetical protein
MAGLAIAVFKDERRNVASYQIVDVLDETTVVCESRRSGEEALRHAESVVDLVGLTPLGHDVALVHDKASLGTTDRERPDRLAIGLTPEGHLVIECEITRLARLAGNGPLDGLPDLGGIESQLLRGPAFPI